MKRFFLVLCVIYASMGSLLGQSKKAEKLLIEAKQDMVNEDVQGALKKLNKALDDSPEFVDAMLFIADIYKSENQIEKSLPYYERAMQHNPPAYAHLFYGKTLYSIGEYSDAKKHLEHYLNSPQAHSKYIEEVQQQIQNCDFAAEAKTKAKPYNPQNLGSKVNSRDMEYFPSISADGNTLVFTHRALDGDRQDEDFYVSTRDSNNAPWKAATPLRGFLNTHQNEGAQAITSDEQIIFFAACERRDGFGSCDIYASFNQGDGTWSKPVNMGENINTRMWESQPSISPDGRTLYFVRGSSGMAKNIDIYTSQLGADGRWQKAQKLKGEVNTPKQETSPFIHFDNQSLYFSSNGHTGMGDLDFFVSRKQEDGTWGKPQNLGYPINSVGQEFSLIVAPDGKTGYFASTMEGGNGLLDLYSFELPEESQAIEIAYVKGKVINKVTKEAVVSTLEFNDLENDSKVISTQSGKDGKYFSVLPGNADYALNIQKKGFLFYSKNFSLNTQTKERAFTLNVELIPIEVGQKVKLENVFFASDSYELDARSHAELQEVVNFLTANPSVKISLEGHTDNEGSPAYNKSLSNNRAKAVKEYLLSKGIAAERLASAGYGDTMPIATNDTEEGRQLNRRTELKITAF